MLVVWVGEGKGNVATYLSIHLNPALLVKFGPFINPGNDEPVVLDYRVINLSPPLLSAPLERRQTSLVKFQEHLQLQVHALGRPQQPIRTIEVPGDRTRSAAIHSIQTPSSLRGVELGDSQKEC